jgi:uncharacterized protein
MVGPFDTIEAIHHTTKTDNTTTYRVAVTRVKFARGSLDVNVAFDEQAQLAGLFFTPVLNETAWTAPVYVKSETFHEESVQVGKRPPLPGTLSIPGGRGPFAIAILVHGSGPNDADESVGGVRVFKDLAQGLASQGVAVLRYTKRTRISPAGVVTEKE